MWRPFKALYTGLCLTYIDFVLQVPHELEQIEEHFHKEECLIKAKCKGKMQCLQIYNAQDEIMSSGVAAQKEDAKATQKETWKCWRCWR
jgi:hypothetical protein